MHIILHIGKDAFVITKKWFSSGCLLRGLANPTTDLVKINVLVVMECIIEPRQTTPASRPLSWLVVLERRHIVFPLTSWSTSKLN